MKEMKRAVEIIRSTTIGKVLNQKPYDKYKNNEEALKRWQELRNWLKNMFILVNDGLPSDDTELGIIMHELNRKYPMTYIDAVDKLEEWSKYVDEDLGRALLSIGTKWYMHREYPKRVGFNQWLNALKNNKLQGYKVISYEKYDEEDTVGQIEFLFPLIDELKAHSGTFLKAHVTYDDDEVGCDFKPDMEKFKQVLISLEKLKVEMNQKLSDIDEQVREILLSDIDDQIVKLQTTRIDLNIKFSFDRDKNEGSVDWVGASKYLFYGANDNANLPTKGFGTIIMKHVMYLLEQWMEQTPRGSVHLTDASKKYVGGAVWDELRALSIWR